VEELALPDEIAAALDDVSGGPLDAREGAGRPVTPPPHG